MRQGGDLRERQRGDVCLVDTVVDQRIHPQTREDLDEYELILFQTANITRDLRAVQAVAVLNKVPYAEHWRTTSLPLRLG